MNGNIYFFCIMFSLEPIIMSIEFVHLNTLLINLDSAPVTGTYDGFRYGYRMLPSGDFTYEDIASDTTSFDILGLRSGALYEIKLDTRSGSTYTEVDRIQARTSMFPNKCKKKDRFFSSTQ